MAHNVETMAYAGETPWHGLGVPVSNDLTPAQMQEKAGLDWKVIKVPTFGKTPSGRKISTGDVGLLRQFKDGTEEEDFLDTVSAGWNVLQNDEAFEFFVDFVGAGAMKMHTAGSLQRGKLVWALAEIDKEFSLFKGKDVLKSFLLLTNSFSYGKAIDTRYTNVRVVCNNTLNMALNGKGDQMISVSHRVKFDPDIVKETLGLADIKMEGYKEMAEFLATKKFDKESVEEYFKTLFPLTSNVKGTKTISRNAADALDVLDTQPGAELGAGTWWQAFNAVTYMTDHMLGHTQDSRLTSAWYGAGRKLKLDALKSAIDFAEKSGRAEIAPKGKTKGKALAA